MMFKLKDFLEVAVPPKNLNSDWLEGAVGAVDFILRNTRSNEIILYSNVGQSYIHAVLAPLSNITPPDGVDLQRAHPAADSHWALERVTGGGEPDRMYLADPLDHPGCKSLVGGEQLVFRRHFTDVDKGPPRTELSQRLVQALDLYWLDEEHAYCRLNEDGDVEPIIRLRDLSEAAEQSGAILVTIEPEQLHRYMAVTETALVVKFDFTRFRPGSFSGWHDPRRGEFEEGDLYHHSGVQSHASFVNGAHILRPLLTKEAMIAKAKREWDGADKEYATFIAHDWKNNRIAEISCAPSALASYFDKGSPLPFQTTPAFFKPEVLQKYKGDLEKYTLDHRSISARGGWYLKSYDVNEAGQVHAYLYDLANLPYREQLYWQSFNERPKGPISKRAIETDFEGNFSTIPDPLIDLKYEVSKLDKIKPDWWKPRGEAAATAVHYPITPSPEEWSNAILALDQLVVEGFVEKSLSARLNAAGRPIEKDWRSLRLLQECLTAAGLHETVAANVIEPLRRVHFLRSKVKGHFAEGEKKSLIKKARTDHGSLAAHFRDLAEDVRVAFDRVIELL
jgi:hypothetical protein